MKVIRHVSTKAARGRGLTLVWGKHPFPEGDILVALSAEGLCWLGINCGVEALRRNWPGAELVEDQGVTRKAAADVARLWPKRLDDLSVPVVLYGTAFQIKVWDRLLKIPAGRTETYVQVARKIGAPAASRAVGSAVGRNPVSIVVPCHRVVNTGGGRVSYGWGARVKLALLAGEGAV